jgi:hypothetical protein
MRDTIDMARRVYGTNTEWTDSQLERLEQLVALVRADERALAAPVQPVKDNSNYRLDPPEAEPAQRQWVGLTDDEFEDIELGCRSTLFGKIEAMRKVEAKLKEKNT